MFTLFVCSNFCGHKRGKTRRISSKVHHTTCIMLRAHAHFAYSSESESSPESEALSVEIDDSLRAPVEEAELVLGPDDSTLATDAAAVNGEGDNALSPLGITEQFYSEVLGMRVVANDNDLLCLRYLAEE
jgi:hypothetical protein